MCVCDKIDWMENGLSGCGKWKVARFRISHNIITVTYKQLQSKIKFLHYHRSVTTSYRSLTALT